MDFAYSPKNGRDAPAMQVFSAMGLTSDTPLANSYTSGRALRYADGPDEVHLQTIARLELREANGSASARHLTPPAR